MNVFICCWHLHLKLFYDTGEMVYNERKVGDSLAVELPALDRSTLVRIQVSQPR